MKKIFERRDYPNEFPYPEYTYWDNGKCFCISWRKLSKDEETELFDLYSKGLNYDMYQDVNSIRRMERV